VNKKSLNIWDSGYVYQVTSCLFERNTIAQLQLWGEGIEFDGNAT